MNLLRVFKRKISKPKWAALCHLAYTDRAGFRYYAYTDELKMPIFRRGEIEKCMMELQYGSDYSEVLDALKVTINSHDKSGNMAPDIAKAGYLVQELIDRKDLLLIPEILFKICANTLIREDENPELVDQELLDHKVTTFKSELQRGGLAAFFHKGELLKSIGLSGISTTDLIRLMNASEQRHIQSQAMIKLLTSGQKSQPG